MPSAGSAEPDLMDDPLRRQGEAILRCPVVDMRAALHPSAPGILEHAGFGLELAFDLVAPALGHRWRRMSPTISAFGMDTPAPRLAGHVADMDHLRWHPRPRPSGKAASPPCHGRSPGSSRNDRSFYGCNRARTKPPCRHVQLGNAADRALAHLRVEERYVGAPCTKVESGIVRGAIRLAAAPSMISGRFGLRRSFSPRAWMAAWRRGFRQMDWVRWG